MDWNLSYPWLSNVSKMSQPNDTTEIVRYAWLAQKDSVQKKKEGGWINRIVRWKPTGRCHCGKSEENDIYLLIRS